MKLLIKDAVIVNADKIREADILIENSRITRIGKSISERVDKKINVKGKFVFPGFIDLHVHLRSPGREDEEDLLSGSQAAAKGGFTKIFCMPNTQPAIDNEGTAKWIIDQAERIGVVDVIPVGAITKNREGKQLTEFAALRRSGCLSLSEDGRSLSNSLLLRRALEYAQMHELLVISHCEDISLSQNGSMRESFVSSKYGISSVPDISEGLIVARNIEVTKYLGTRIHLTHISTAKSIKIIKAAKRAGVAVTADTCPHYFILTVDDIEKRNFDSNLKVNPPLGEKKDVEEIKAALKEGIIDCLTTDHAPHSQAEKELPFEDAPFGFIGLEFAFSLAHTYLVKEEVIDLKEIAKIMAFNPAKIVGLKKCGEIKEGFFADLAVVGLDRKQKVEKETIVSKSKNTPFLGYELEGVVEYTIHKGKIVYEAGGDWHQQT